jgi:hypothetical protein
LNCAWALNWGGRGLTQRTQRAQRKETQTEGARVRRRGRNVAGNDSSPRRLQERFGGASSWEGSKTQRREEILTELPRIDEMEVGFRRNDSSPRRLQERFGGASSWEGTKTERREEILTELPRIDEMVGFRRNDSSPRRLHKKEKRFLTGFTGLTGWRLVFGGTTRHLVAYTELSAEEHEEGCGDECGSEGAYGEADGGD